MSIGRLLLYALLGAVVAACAIGIYQLSILASAGADFRAISAKALLVDVMELPRYGLFGAAVAVVTAPLSSGWYTLWGRLGGWLLLASLAALLVPLAGHVLGHGVFPRFDEFIWAFSPANKYLMAGLSVALVAFALETVRTLVSLPRRDIPEAQEGDREYPADEFIKEARRRRAEAYLARRRAAKATQRNP